MITAVPRATALVIVAWHRFQEVEETALTTATDRSNTGAFSREGVLERLRRHGAIKS